ncbi:MAG TPA: CdaR family protein [Candidatus Dormibacteraeota bacterium]|nr:CdaR family protein [Candidatus Dormibacteraeota bacterium]
MSGRLALLVTRNFQLKVIAVVVACGMWVGVVYASDPPAIMSYSVPVQASGVLRSGLVLVRPIAAVAVKVAGVASNVRNQAEVRGHLAAQADLSRITKVGEYNVPLKIVKSDSNVWIWSAPRTVAVLIDRVATRSIPVHLSVSSAPPVGFTVNLAQSAITPADVTVRGPSTLLANLQAEAVVNLSTVRASFPILETVKLSNTAGLGSELTVTPSVVSVGVVIASESTQVLLPVRTTFAGSGQPPTGYTLAGIQVIPLTITVFGPASVLTSLTAVSTEPIDLAHVTASETVNAQLVAPSGSTLSVGSVSVVLTITPVASASPTPTPSPTP